MLNVGGDASSRIDVRGREWRGGGREVGGNRE